MVRRCPHCKRTLDDMRDLAFDEETRAFTLRGKKLALGQVATDILAVLYHSVSVVSEAELAELVYGRRNVTARAISANMNALRKKIEPLGLFVVAQRGRGRGHGYYLEDRQQ